MSNPKQAVGAGQAAKNFVKNLSQHKGKLAAAILAAGCVIYYGYSGMLEKADLTLSNEARQSIAVQTKTIGEAKGPTGQAQVNFQKDETGINAANAAALTNIEEKSYSAKVYTAADNNESEIIEKGTTDKKLRFKSENDTIQKLDREEIKHSINIPNVSTNTIVIPPKITFIDEVEQVPQNTYATPSIMSDIDLSLATQDVEKNVKDQFTKILTASERSNTNNGEIKFSKGNAFDITKAQRDAAENERKELLKKQQEMQVQYAMMPSRGGYIPSDTVVKTHDSHQGYYNSEVLFKMGEIVNAVTLMSASNLNMGPIKVQITEGNFNGAILNGTVSQGIDKLYFQFSSMYLPNADHPISINAIALDYRTQEVGTATNVDRKPFLNYVIRPLLKAGSAIGNYYASNEGTTTTTSSGTVVQSSAKKSMEDARKVALGEALASVDKDIDAIDTSVEITQAQYSPIKLYFTQEVIYDPKKEISSLSRDSVRNTYVQPLGSENSRQVSQSIGSVSYQALQAEREPPLMPVANPYPTMPVNTMPSVQPQQ